MVPGAWGPEQQDQAQPLCLPYPGPGRSDLVSLRLLWFFDKKGVSGREHTPGHSFPVSPKHEIASFLYWIIAYLEH